MNEADEGDVQESSEACPACGARRLAVLSFPALPGSSPSDAEVPLGGRAADPSPPAIGCLACGTEWAGLDAFRRAAGGKSG